ncbi:MarP family serine protease [Nakamurella sp. YIM 132087]|uniref:MarP family serine protease n=1 Tax=Nakamurella alba TaxID=2665158 RepID=A0A7K1FUN6_9ACTN|nr:MarP family serine protease [Nakamurella alba]MTD17059.1 MarP family serine protease [Nakamurella alba]
MTWVDALVIALLLGAAWSGFRRGFVASTVSLVGAVGGAVLAIRLAPLAMEWADVSAAKVAIGIACVILGVGIGELAGSTVGRAIADRFTWQPARVLDRGLGLVGHTLAVLIVTWMIAIPVASTPYPWLASAVRSSAVLGAVDDVMPSGLRDVSDRMRQLFDDSGFPAILDPLTPTPDVAVDAPDTGVAALPAVRTAAESVLKVRGRAPSCSRAIEGSGFVIGPQKLMTNAHVVAGTQTVQVEQGGELIDATVVLYDSDRDLAVLDVPDLDRPVLDWDTATADTGADAVAIGYPLDGPLTLTAARISAEFPLRGPNIYNSSTVTRDVYTVRGQIRSGNSGGPLVGTDGAVLGVVFGASLDQPDVGFVLTAEEAASTLEAGLTDTTAAATGVCTAD